jgi:hypothetical protein
MDPPPDSPDSRSVVVRRGDGNEEGAALGRRSGLICEDDHRNSWLCALALRRTLLLLGRPARPGMRQRLAVTCTLPREGGAVARAPDMACRPTAVACQRPSVSPQLRPSCDQDVDTDACVSWLRLEKQISSIRGSLPRIQRCQPALGVEARGRAPARDCWRPGAGAWSWCWIRVLG